MIKINGPEILKKIIENKEYQIEYFKKQGGRNYNSRSNLPE